MLQNTEDHGGISLHSTKHSTSLGTHSANVHSVDYAGLHYDVCSILEIQNRGRKSSNEYSFYSTLYLNTHVVTVNTDAVCLTKCTLMQNAPTVLEYCTDNEELKVQKLCIVTYKRR